MTFARAYRTIAPIRPAPMITTSRLMRPCTRGRRPAQRRQCPAGERDTVAAIAKIGVGRSVRNAEIRRQPKQLPGRRRGRMRRADNGRTHCHFRSVCRHAWRPMRPAAREGHKTRPGRRRDAGDRVHVRQRGRDGVGKLAAIRPVGPAVRSMPRWLCLADEHGFDVLWLCTTAIAASAWGPPCSPGAPARHRVRLRYPDGQRAILQ